MKKLYNLFRSCPTFFAPAFLATDGAKAKVYIYAPVTLHIVAKKAVRISFSAPDEQKHDSS
jgi:hypothetical protein